MNKEEIKRIITQQRAYYTTGITRDISFRRKKLKALLKALSVYENDILEALHNDLKKHAFEAFSSEITTLRMELRHTLDHMSFWAQPETVSTPLVHWPATSKIIKEPLGLVLIFAPWNYPVLLSLAPVISAVAAGNCCVVKPSEFTPESLSVIHKIITSVFEPAHVCVIAGEGHVVGPLLLESPEFNHVFFTGSPSVGREIMQMASRHLIPVTLELGGKSPAIVESDCKVKEAARRIVWGKFWNCGQTCIAPDYVLVHESKYSEFIAYAKASIQDFYGDNPAKSESYGRIIHNKHFNQVKSYIAQGELICGGTSDESSLYIEPTLIRVEDLNQEVMKKEIFGPVLPVVTFKNTDEALSIISQNPDSLALYIFTRNSLNRKRYLQEARFGGGGVNMPLLHFATVHMPLEGVGTSGMGNYHGRYGFDTFTHRKSILSASMWMDLPLKYPPFPAFKGFIRWIMRSL